MKSRWLKKAMAAFLAVLMTVCALPVAAFVPETVETGEEFNKDLASATLASTPPTITEAEVSVRINDLVSKLNGKFFNTDYSQACVSSNPNCSTTTNNGKKYHASCDHCDNRNVVTATWFQNMFGNVSVSNVTFSPDKGLYLKPSSSLLEDEDYSTLIIWSVEE